MQNITRIIKSFPILFACLLLQPLHAFANEEFGGFGISVAQLFDDSQSHQGAIVVLHVPEKSLAEDGGIRPGDIILEIDGKPSAGNDFQSIVLNMLRGPVDSSATLKIQRATENKPLTVTVKRTRITFPASSRVSQ